MDEFQRAIHKYERNKANRERSAMNRTILTMPKSETAIPEVPEASTFTVPKEKRNTDAVITVFVELPYDSFELVFVKENIVSNVVRKPTKADFKKAIEEGLKPLLGRVK